MKRIYLFQLFTFFSLVFLSSMNLSSAGGSACGSFLAEDGLTKGECKHAHIDAGDKASLQRGVQIYMNNCLGCHSLKYARYKKVSEDLEIPLGMFQDNLIFGDQKMGDLITVGMDPKEAKEWFGNAPPDLTLEAGLRGSDWIYTYLTSFYLDETRPLGVNNKVYENVGMPHVLIDMQGTPRSVCRDIPLFADNGGVKQDPLTGIQLTEEKCGFLEVDSGTGELSPQEFDSAMLDLTNFLAYMTDPLKIERETLGTYTLLYLIIFTMLSYLLYREFKKDLH